MKLLSTLNSVFSKLNISRINYWKHVLASMVITFAVPASAKTYEVLNATCHFSSAWTYQFDDDTVGTYSVINQSMSVKDGATTEDTLAADGLVRATNSKSWSYVRGTQWIGDFGELLTIDGFGKSYGTHRAVLQDSIAGFWASIWFGKCTGNFDETAF